MPLWPKVAVAVPVALLLAVALALGLLALWPRAAAEALAGQLLQRRVSIGSLEIGWGNPLRLRLRELALADAGDDGAPPMLSIAAIAAEIDTGALLDGRLVYRRLQVERPLLVLARDGQGRGNWSFGDDTGSDPGNDTGTPRGGLALIPKDRTQFPALLDMTLTGGLVRYRTSSGRWLSIPLDALAIRSAGEDAPVTMTLDGGYNDTDAQLSATTASFRSLRDPALPFDAAFTIIAPMARLDFRGVIDAPLDFDGVQGRMVLQTRQLDALLAVFGGTIGLDALPLRLSGGASRSGDRWSLDAISGDLGDSRFDGSLSLQEGARGAGDRIGARLDFERLDLATLQPAAGARESWRDLALAPPSAPDTAHVDLQLRAAQVMQGDWQAAALTLAATAAPGRIDIRQLEARVAGGTLTLQAQLRRAGQDAGNDTGRLEASLGLDGADAAHLLAMAGLPPDLAGTIDLQAQGRMTGPRLGAAMSGLQGQVVVAMPQGRIGRSLVERASTDLRTLLRTPAETTALHCLLGVMVLQDGRGDLAPLVLRSDGGTIRGAGSIDLATSQIDLVIRADPRTTGLFALDLPIRLSGRLDGADGLSAMPDRAATLPALPVPRLQGAAERLAARNPCRR
jgi:uncharacterized protein involved in outer membrane biogenesis